jgi:hypothetical protein
MANTKKQARRKPQRKVTPQPVHSTTNQSPARPWSNKRQKSVTYQQYSDHMDEIIHKYDNVPDALIEMIEYSASVKIKQCKSSAVTKKCRYIIPKT